MAKQVKVLPVNNRDKARDIKNIEAQILVDNPGSTILLTQTLSLAPNNSNILVAVIFDTP